MAKVLLRITGFYEALPDLLRRNRMKTWGVMLFLTVFAGFGLPGLKVDMSLESWFRGDDPTVVAFMSFRDSFGSDDALYIVYRPKDGDVFSEASLNAVADLQEELLAASLVAEADEDAMLGHLIEIKSLINVSYMQVEGDSLISRDFVGEEIPTSVQERERLRREALAHKDYPLFYLSEDSQYGGIYIRTDFGTTPVDEVTFEESDGFDMEFVESSAIQSGKQERIRYKTVEMADYARFIEEVNNIVEQPQYTDLLEFYPVGNPVIMKFFDDVLNVEMSYILLGTIALMFLALLYLFRSLSAVFWPILIILLTMVTTLGVVAWLDITMSMMISLLVMMVLVVGVADSIHILSGYIFFRRQQLDHQASLRAVMKKSGFACMLTSLTTAAGLLAMTFVPIPPIAKFGVSAAIGVILAFLFTIILLPLLLDIWHPISLKQERKIRSNSLNEFLILRWLKWIEPLTYRYPKWIIGLFLVVGLISFYGLTRVKVNSNMVELIRNSDPTYQAHILVDKVMGGTQGMEILLDFGQTDALKDPEVLNRMDALQNYLLKEHPRFVVRTTSLVNVVKDSYQVLNENREEMYVIPQNPTTLAQTLLLFDSANPEDRRLLVTDNYDRGRMTIRMKNYGSIEYLDFFDEVQAKTDELFIPLRNQYPELEVKLTGSLALMMQLVDYMSWAQVQSFGLALIVITIMLLFVFGSPKLGLAGMIPNLFPVIVTFGVMGFFNISLDADTLIIAPIVIGIAVDDTIHFLTHFRTELVESDNLIHAIETTLREVGQAISFSTIILVFGFLILVFSSHLGMAHFGYLTAVAFISALLADVLLLPAICTLLYQKKKTATVVAV